MNITTREPVRLALTLWPEWAWAICHAGKRVENRTWHPGARLAVGARLAIHAGAHIGGRPGADVASDAVDVVMAMWETGGPLRSNDERRRLAACQRSSIVAVATIDVYDQEQRTWWDVPGQWHWRLRDIQVLDTPIPHRGAQGLWTPSPEALAALQAVAP